LIGGDFAADEVYMNADVEVNGQLKITGGNPGTNKVLMSDASGLASWSAQGGGGGVGASAYTAYMNANNMFSPHENNCGADAFVPLFTGAAVGFCMERNERSSSSFRDAQRTCLALGKRLPEPVEWNASCHSSVELGLNDMIGNREFVSNFAILYSAETSGNFYTGIAVPVSGETHCNKAEESWIACEHELGQQAYFRCVR
jgi:hypothetical protein